MSLNNYTISYSNIRFLIKNSEMVLTLNSIENGKTVTVTRTTYPKININHFTIMFIPIYKKINKLLTFIMKKKFSFNFIKHPEIESKIKIDYFTVEPKSIYKNIDELLSSIMGVKFNKDKFIKYYNRYVILYSKEKGINIDDFPLNINYFLKLTDINSSQYDINNIIKNLILNNIPITEEIFLSIISKNKKIKSNLDLDLLNPILNNLKDKVIEYKNGKINLINLFFGEYLKKLLNKNVDKKELMNNIKLYLDENYNVKK